MFCFKIFVFFLLINGFDQFLNLDFPSFTWSSCVAHFCWQSFKFFCKCTISAVSGFNFVISKFRFWFSEYCFSFFSRQLYEPCLIRCLFSCFLRNIYFLSSSNFVDLLNCWIYVSAVSELHLGFTQHLLTRVFRPST